MDELIFVIEDDPEGGLSARALGASIFTQADDQEALREAIRDAVLCHYADPTARPRMVRLCPPSPGLSQ